MTNDGSSLPSTPYVTGQMITAALIGKTVRLVGRVIQVSSDGSMVDLEAPDGCTVRVRRLQHSDPYPPGSYVCVLGKIGSDLCLNESIWDSFGDNFDLASFGKLVAQMPSNPDLFATVN